MSALLIRARKLNEAFKYIDDSYGLDVSADELSDMYDHISSYYDKRVYVKPDTQELIQVACEFLGIEE